MALLVNPGYTGYAEIAGDKVRFTDASITARQEINAQDLIMGHWDHNAYVFGPVTVDGSISGPVTENFVGTAGSIWEWATKRSGDCGELAKQTVDLYYFCDAGVAYGIAGRKFEDLQVNSVNFSCSAGDIAQFSIDVMGATPPSNISSTAADHTLEEKLVTWDKVGVTIIDGTGSTLPIDVKYSNFDFTITNNLEVVYGIGQPDLYPFEIVPGLRGLTGSLSAYNVPETLGADTWDDYAAGDYGTITFAIGTATFTFNVQFHRMEPASSVGPIISTIGFTGVGHQATLDV